MSMKLRNLVLVLAASAIAGCGGAGVSNSQFVGAPSSISGVSNNPGNTVNSLNVVARWNRIAIDASGFDHSQIGARQQLGPTRSSRAMAIVHIAMHDAIQAIQRRYDTFLPQPGAPTRASAEAAAVQAAHDTLVALYPAQKAALDQLLFQELAQIPDSLDKSNGVLVGQIAAQSILANRANDGSTDNIQNQPYSFGQLPGQWRVDPLNPTQQPLGANWSAVRPFVLTSASQFRCPVPPALTSPAYTAAYNEVKAVGGDGVITPTVRTADQTEAGIYWAYDGTPSLCAPPRLYNQIALQLATQRGLSEIGELARFLALTNLAMADAGISAWESKYFYNYWRPICGIRESDPGTGPSGLGDGNAATVGDPGWVPLCAPASNLQAPNFTPPFPAYPSGHACFGGALFGTMRRALGTDNVPFTFVSDEFNGITRDNLGNVRPLRPRSFNTLSQAEEENGQSRIYLGIHWSFDKVEGISQGEKVAEWVFTHSLSAH
ncbi:MAG: phosphatase PAP2 family protein [Vulcanimicrobiota bacterium]